MCTMAGGEDEKVLGRTSGSVDNGIFVAKRSGPLEHKGMEKGRESSPDTVLAREDSSETSCSHQPAQGTAERRGDDLGGENFPGDIGTGTHKEVSNDSNENRVMRTLKPSPSVNGSSSSHLSPESSQRQSAGYRGNPPPSLFSLSLHTVLCNIHHVESLGELPEEVTLMLLWVSRITDDMLMIIQPYSILGMGRVMTGFSCCTVHISPAVPLDGDVSCCFRLLHQSHSPDVLFHSFGPRVR